MHKVLNEIIEQTKEEVEVRKKRAPLNNEGQLAQNNEGSPFFEQAIVIPRDGDIAVIGEIKLASPSEPYLGSQEDIETRAIRYAKAGVDAISVVTEKHFFKGDQAYVRKIRQAAALPVLQKDFVIDAYQIYESKKSGADAILFIARLVEKGQLVDFVDLSLSLGLAPVVEVHSDEDLEKTIATSTRIIAVNARDLDTMEVSVDRACELLKKAPRRSIKLGFSGVVSKDEVEKYAQAGASGVLVGTSLMKAENIEAFLEGLR